MTWGDLLGWLAPADFTIRYRPGRGARVRGLVPRSKVAGIAGFFAHDIAVSGPVKVRGFWLGRRPGGGLRLRISGPIAPADHQKVRNFLLAHLR